MIPLYEIDNFMVSTFKEQDFIDFCNTILGEQLDIYVQVDKRFLAEKSNYIYIANFERFDNKESPREELYRCFIDFVIDLNDPVNIDNVTKHIEKEALEKVVIYAIQSIQKNLKSDGITDDKGDINRKLKLLSATTNIAETDGADTIKCVVPISLGITNKTIGECQV